MRSWRLAGALALLVACGELRKADKGPPSQPPSANPSHPHGEEPEEPLADGGPQPNDDASVVPPVLCTDCPVETVLNQPGTFGPILVDDANVYISEIGKHTYRCAKTGCDAPTTLFADGATRMALADGKIWVPDHQSIYSCATTGCGGTRTLALTEPGLIGDIATDGTRVVWRFAVDSDVLRSCPAASCAAATAVTIKDNINSRIMTAGSGLLVWITAASEVVVCKNDEPCIEPRHLGSLALTDVAVNADTAFWVTESSEIAKCPLGGCGEHPTIITKVNAARATIADATHVYWRSTTDNAIERCPISDCAAPETIATGVATTTGFQNLALDDEYVYWATSDGVFRRRK